MTDKEERDPRAPVKKHLAVDIAGHNISERETAMDMDRSAPAAIKRLEQITKSIELSPAQKRAIHNLRPHLLIRPAYLMPNREVKMHAPMPHSPMLFKGAEAQTKALENALRGKLMEARNGVDVQFENTEVRYLLEHPQFVQQLDNEDPAKDLNEYLIHSPTFSANVAYMYLRAVDELENVEVPWGIKNQDIINQAADLNNEFVRLYLQQLYGITNVDNVIMAGIYTIVQTSGQQHAGTALLAMPQMPLSAGVNDQIDAIMETVIKANLLLKKEIQEDKLEQLDEFKESRADKHALREAHNKRSQQRKEIRADQSTARKHEREQKKHAAEEDLEEKKESTEETYEDAQLLVRNYLQLRSIINAQAVHDYEGKQDPHHKPSVK